MLEGTYKYSYKADENLLTSLSVYNVGHQKCGPGYQWGTTLVSTILSREAGSTA